MTTFIISWFALGAVAAVLNYGILLAYFQRTWPTLAVDSYREDCGMSALTSTLVFFSWPVVLVAVAMTGFCKHGLMYSRPKPELRDKYAIPYGNKKV